MKRGADSLQSQKIKISMPIKNYPQDEEGRILIHRAAEKGLLAIMDILFKQGFPVNTVSSVTGMSALHYAIRGGKDLTIVKNLILHGADVNLTCRAGKTPSEYYSANAAFTYEDLLATLNETGHDVVPEKNKKLKKI